MAETEEHKMKRRIRIGYTGYHRNWEQLLEQIGVDWVRLEPGKPVSVQDYSCVIADRKFNRTEFSNLKTYLHDGGALLDTTGEMCGGTIQNRSLTVIKPSSINSLFGHITEIPVYGEATLHSSAGLLEGTVWLESSPVKNCAFCGLPVSRLWREYNTTHKTFGYSAGAITAERTSSLQSNPYFEVILTLLKVLHDRSGLPFVHKWWHPDGEKDVATLRVDSDYSDLNEIRSVSEAATKYALPLTWFLHVEHHEPYLSNIIQTLPAHDEIALHCYSHREYTTAEQYKSDIKRGNGVLKQNGAHPRGYAAPYGHWSAPLAASLRDLPFSYTSEFSYDFDSLPSVPASSGILQLPVHPVSIGSFRRFKADSSDIQDYFRRTVRLMRLKHQPLHLYHHPLDGTPDQWENLLSLLKTKNHRWMTYSQWCSWWKQRSEIFIASFFDVKTGCLEISGTGEPAIPVAIQKDGKIHISDSKDPAVYLDELTFRPYIASELKQLIYEQQTAPGFSWFERTKDQILTRLWRNRT